jgi:hypothetical protein
MENVRGHKRMEQFVIISLTVLQARVITIIVEEKSFQITLIQLINKRRFITIQLRLQVQIHLLLLLLLLLSPLQIKTTLILTNLLTTQMEMEIKRTHPVIQVEIQITIPQQFQLPLLTAMIYGPTLNITYKRIRNK